MGSFAVFLLLFILLLEGASFAGLWWFSGKRPSAASLHQEQEQVAGYETTGAQALLGARTRRRPRYLAREAVHPYVGFLPTERAVHSMQDAVSFNSEAFYAPDSPVFVPEPDELVVGITGGSVAVFFAREGRQQLAAELAKHPRFAGRRIVFAVLAFGGFKQPQQLMALSYLLSLGGRLDLLINLDGFNEVALHASQNGAQGVMPSFPRDWLLRTSADPAGVPALGELAHLAQRRRATAERAIESPWRRSWTYRLSWKLRDRAYLEGLRRAQADLREHSRSSDPSRVGPALGREPLDELVGLWRESSRQLDHLCRANGIEYYHFLQPNQYVEGSKVLSASELENAYSANHPYGREVPAGYARLLPARAELAADGVRCHDLTEIFSEVTETVYEDDCCHMNELGNELMARAIADAILSYSD